MAPPIESIYVARSEPSILAATWKQDYDTFIDDSDEIDFVVTGNGRAVLFERKQAGDLLRSFVDANESSGEPRVMAQLRRLQETVFTRSDDIDAQPTPALRVLLIEGNIGQNRAGYATVDGGLIATKIPFNAIDNFLMVVQAWGIRVARSTSLTHTPARVIAIAEGWLSTEDKEPILMLPRATPAQIRTPMTFPGIGIKRSKALFRQYKNLNTVLGALLALADGNEEEIATVLDKGIREKVRAYINKPITWTDKHEKH